MVRLGGKSTARTEPLLIRNQQTDFRFSRRDHDVIKDFKFEIEDRAMDLTSSFWQYLWQSSTRYAELMYHLELEEAKFYAAFDDLDSYDLIRAGLLTPGNTKMTKGKLRLATIGEFFLFHAFNAKFRYVCR